MVTRKFLFIAVGLLLATVSHLPAQQKLRAGVAGQSPFVNPGNGEDGAALDIWEKIASENGWLFEYTKVESVEKGLEAVANGSLDILVGNAPINENNLRLVEFSQPFFHSGLQILTGDQTKSMSHRLLEDVKDLLKLEILWVVVCGIIALSAAVYFFERKHNPDFPKSRKDGVAEALYYVVTLALTGKSVYKGFPGVLGRMVLLLWVVLGLITVAYVTSSITSAMTVEKLSNSIQSPKDLYNKTVAVISDSPAEEYLKNEGIDEVTAHDLESAVKIMLAKQSDAVVADAAILQAFDFNNPRLPVRVAGRVFQIENYGFAVPIGSPIRIPLNRHLAKMQELGELNTILAAYFGEANVQ